MRNNRIISGHPTHLIGLQINLIRGWRPITQAMKALLLSVPFFVLMVNCLKMTVSMTRLLEVGGNSFRSLMHAVPLECPHLPRLLASDLPFPGIRGAYHYRITKDEACKLVETFIGTPETHELMFSIVIVIGNPNLLSELQKHPNLYTPKVSSRGEIQQLTIDHMIHLQDSLVTYARRAFGHQILHISMLLDSFISSMTINDDLKHENTTEGMLLLIIETMYLVFLTGFKAELSHNLKLFNEWMGDITRLLRRPKANPSDITSWLVSCNKILGILKSIIPDDPGRLAYWWAKFLSVVFTILTESKTCSVEKSAFLEQYFSEAAYWCAPPSLIDTLLHSAFKSGIGLSQETKVRLDDYFITLYENHLSRPYYGSKGKVALQAWRNVLCFMHRHDSHMPISITGYEDLVYYYGSFTGSIATTISTIVDLPVPIEIGKKLCNTHACFLKCARRLLFREFRSITTRKRVITFLASRSITERRAIIRLFLTLLANSEYNPDPLEARIITSIAKSQDDSPNVTFLKQLIQESCFLEYVRFPFPTE